MFASLPVTRAEKRTRPLSPVVVEEEFAKFSLSVTFDTTRTKLFRSLHKWLNYTLPIRERRITKSFIGFFAVSEIGKPTPCGWTFYIWSVTFLSFSSLWPRAHDLSFALASWLSVTAFSAVFRRLLSDIVFFDDLYSQHYIAHLKFSMLDSKLYKRSIDNRSSFTITSISFSL